MLGTTHFVANHLQDRDGYTFTLTTRLSRMLNEVEDRYGQRDMTWTIVGVEFGPEANPQTWYPGSHQNRKHVAIQLTATAIDNDVRACYQLAHECVHLLAPSGKTGGAPVIEEGLATVYSEDFVARTFGQIDMTPAASPYARAAATVRQLLSIDPGAIRALRSIEPSFQKMTVATFHGSELLVPPNVVTELLTPFSSFS